MLAQIVYLTEIQRRFMFVASKIFLSKIMAMQYKDFQSRNFYVKALYEVI